MTRTSSPAFASHTIITNQPLIPDQIQQVVDPELRIWLKNKRRVYLVRLDSSRRSWSRLDTRIAYKRFLEYRLTRHKLEILTAIIRIDEPYKLIDLNLLRMCIKQDEFYEGIFDAKAFEQAKLVILFYIGALSRAIEAGAIKKKLTFPPDHPYSDKSRRKKGKKK